MIVEGFDVIDREDGFVRVERDGRLMECYDYDGCDRTSQKRAHAEARAFVAGWAACAATLGLNSAGIPVFEGTAA